MPGNNVDALLMAVVKAAQNYSDVDRLYRSRLWALTDPKATHEDIGRYLSSGDEQTIAYEGLRQAVIAAAAAIRSAEREGLPVPEAVNAQPMRPWYRLCLADGTVLWIPLDHADQEGCDRVGAMWEDLWAMPGVQEVLEKYGVIVERASAKGAEEK